VQIGELRERLGGLPSPLEAQGIWRGIWLEEAHHSTAIEGNTLVLRQVERLLDEGLAVGHRSSEALAEVHARFQQIHPFLDGNGRTGRLLLNLLLVRLGYPPAIIYKRDRSRYLRALRRADSGDFGTLGEMLARATLDNLYRLIVPAVAGPNRLVRLPVLASGDLSHDALRVAASRGRLKASRAADGSWRSSRVWVDEYLADKHRRRIR